MIVRPALGEIERAAEILGDVLLETPLLPLRDPLGARGIRLKPESLQRVSSFKIRGVFHAVACLDPTARACGLSTVSAGNTAQALAWCGRHFGVSARCLMPEQAPRTKIDAVRYYGGEPVLVPTDELFRFLRERLWEQEPDAFIHPWIERNVMIGHGTIGLEILDEAPQIESVFVPVGGGGLIAGVGSALKARRPQLKLIGVEPEGCPALYESFVQGKPAHVACETICDGVAVPYITDELYPLLRELVDEVRLVSEDEVKRTIRQLAFENGLVVEGSAALSVAAARAVDESDRGQSVCVVTGRSIDRDKLQSILG